MKSAVVLSLILSILHSILFWGKDFGISIFLFVVVGLSILVYILNKEGKIKNKKALIINIPILLLSSTYFIFNNTFFYVMNIIAIVALFVAMLVLATEEKNKIDWPSKAFNILFSPFELIEESSKTITEELVYKNEKVENEKNNKILKQIIKGILIALPILIVVLVLLSSADDIFAGIFTNITRAIFDTIKITSIMPMIFRILVIIALFIYFVGFFINIKDRVEEDSEDNESWKNKISIEQITLNTVLTLLNVVYLIFTITQGIQLFNYIQSTKGLNYASYARSGFFQLMAVSFINFAIIFISNNNKKDVSKESKNYSKYMNILMAIFTIIILISSVLRMNLYEQKYGYTFLRLMVYFIQITELILIIPTIMYILNKKVKIFKYYFVIITSMYVLINFVNIDKMIAKSNVNRYFEKEEIIEIDFAYLKKSTSEDAIPEIIELLNVQDEELKNEVNNYLYNEYQKLKEERNWQEFNLAKNKAEKLLKELNLEYIESKNNSTTRYNNNYNIYYKKEI